MEWSREGGGHRSPAPPKIWGRPDSVEDPFPEFSSHPSPLVPLRDDVPAPVWVPERKVVWSPPTLVWVKFYFTNPKIVPPGIQERDHLTAEAQAERLKELAAECGDQALAEFGRYREGRADTGRKVCYQEMIQVAILGKGLGVHRYVFLDLFYHVQAAGKESKSNRDKYVVTVIYGRMADGKERPTLSTRVVLSRLSRTTWQACHLWMNTGLNTPVTTTTINLMGLQQNLAKGSTPNNPTWIPMPPKAALVVRQNAISIIETKVMMEEDEA